MGLYRIFKNDPRVGSWAHVTPTGPREPFEGQIIAAVQAPDPEGEGEEMPRQWAVMPDVTDDPVYFATLEELTG